jgi:hypothetical protein
MSGAKGVTANFAPMQRSLTVNVLGDGTVASSPSGISCGGDCTESYDHGTSVTLTATPNGTYALDSWSGCDSTNGNQCTVAMTAAENVTATFTTDPRALTIQKSGVGTGAVSSIPVGIDCGDTCESDFDSGATLTLTATDGPNSTFAGWSGCDSTDGNECTIVMNADRTVTAHFELVEHALTVQPRRAAGDSVASGTVASDVGGINCAIAADCSQDFTHGSTVVLTATPAANNSFVTWIGCDSPSGNTCTMTMSSPKAVGAEFHNTSVPSSTVTVPVAPTSDSTQVFGYQVAAGAGTTATAIELWVNGPGAGDFVKLGEVADPVGTGSFDEYEMGEGDGTYLVMTRARNSAGNYEPVDGTPTSFVLDTTAPDSSVSSPTTQYRVNSFSVGWSSTDDTDPSGVDSVEIWVDGPGAGPAAMAGSKPGAASGTYTFSATDGAGTYSFYSVAVDGAGNREAPPTLGPDVSVTVVLCPGFESDPRVHVVGTNAKNTLTGTNAGEVFCGLGGNDTMRGLGGSDLFVGGAGVDTVTYSERTAKQAVVVTVNKGANDGKKNERDHVASGIEIVLGGKGNDILTGDGAANTFKGGSGNDSLKGAGGGDKLYGDKGKDKLDGGPAKDVCKTGESLKGCERR